MTTTIPIPPDTDDIPLPTATDDPTPPLATYTAAQIERILAGLRPANYIHPAYYQAEVTRWTRALERAKGAN